MSKSYWLSGDDQNGNFSNEKQDTFDTSKDYIGIRLQQGVPLLDRDWNELEDIRRHELVELKKNYIGNGTPDGGFRISALESPANDFIISPGRFIVDGFVAVNGTEIHYTGQDNFDPDLEGLTTPDSDRIDLVYLDVWISEVTAADDTELGNTDDIHMETCVRHKLNWRVRVDEGSTGYEQFDFHHYYELARITRRDGESNILDEDIQDMRVTVSKLSDMVVHGKDVINARIMKVPLLRQTLFGRKVPEIIDLGISDNLLCHAFDGMYMWFPAGSKGVFKVNIYSNLVNNIDATLPAVYETAFDGTHMWLPCHSTNRLKKINILDNTLVEIGELIRPSGIAFDGTHMWIGSKNINEVYKYNINYNTIDGFVEVALGRKKIAFDGSHIWVANRTEGGDEENTVRKIDINNNTVIETIRLGNRPTGIAFDGSYIWVSIAADHNISKIDINSNTVKTIPVDGSPYCIAFDGSYIWIGNVGGDHNISKIDINSNTVVEIIPVNTPPNDIAFDGTHIWVGSLDGKIFKIPV